tara:strand:+ start:1206 stop:2171 length:966 start_codon:yes stop_codon:yes gene_type:complete
MSKEKILITGASGFIGYHLCKKILSLKKYQLTCIDVKKSDKKNLLKDFVKNKDFKYLKLDLNNLKKKKFQNFSYVFHLAAIVGVKQVNNNPLNSFVNNTFIFSNLIHNLETNSSKTKIIFFSTSEVYGPLSDLGKLNYPTKEDINLLISKKTKGRDSYYLSKMFGEKTLEFSKLNYCILRPHNIYGPYMGFKHVISELIKKLSSKKNSFKIYSPNHTRSFCYIDDAVTQILKLSFNNRSNKKIFNIGNPKDEIKIKKLSILIKKILNSKIKLTNGPNTIGSPRRRVPSINKTLKITKKIYFTSLNEGIKKTIKWYDKQKRA